MKTEKSNLVRTTRFMNNLHHMAFTLLCKATYHQGADIFRANSRGRQCFQMVLFCRTIENEKRQALMRGILYLCCGDYFYKEI